MITSILKHLTLLLIPLLVACGGSKGILKDIEGGAYDAAAETISIYCRNAEDRPLFVQRTRIEARREIRQRGRNGPEGMSFDGLDEKTAHGPGPILAIYCEGDRVPVGVFEGLIRDWED